VTRDPLRLITFLLAVVGLAVAAYLTYVHYAGIKSVCAIAHGCEIVQTSKWSKLAGVPVALLGLISYVAIVGALLIRHELATMAATATAWIGFAFSLYLTYREIWTIEAICIWCVTSAVILTILTVLTTALYLRGEPVRGPAPEG
jgi:uncharacterized membrane protein